MSVRRENLFLDRAVLVSFAVSFGKRAVQPTTSTLFESITQQYPRLLYEASGMSGLEKIIRAHESVAGKLVCLEMLDLKIRPGEKKLLDATVAEAVKLPGVIHAIDQFGVATSSNTRSREEVLGYAIRLLLAARAMEADILTSHGRDAIIQSLFEASNLAYRTHAHDGGFSFIQSEPCCFPYVPAPKVRKALYEFKILQPGEHLFEEFHSNQERGRLRPNPSRVEPTSDQVSQGTRTSNRFSVALSFPGEHRDFVLLVAEALASTLTRDRVFYDEWYEVELLGTAGDLKLQSIYQQADLVIPFFSRYYDKAWCSLEWETIRGVLLSRRKDDAVIPVHLDDTTVPGWSAVNFGIRLRGRDAGQIADVILQAHATRDPNFGSFDVGDAPTVSGSTPLRGRMLAIWKEKLDYFYQQEAIATDPAQKFALMKQIEEVKEKIAGTDSS